MRPLRIVPVRPQAEGAPDPADRFAMARVLQCVAFGGVSSSVSAPPAARRLHREAPRQLALRRCRAPTVGISWR